MPTNSQTLSSPMTEMDLSSYQQFWETVDPAVLRQHAGNHVALEHGESGWRIVAAADDLDELQAALTRSGTDVSSLVFDRVHIEESTAAGVELQ